MAEDGFFWAASLNCFWRLARFFSGVEPPNWAGDLLEAFWLRAARLPCRRELQPKTETSRRQQNGEREAAKNRRNCDATKPLIIPVFSPATSLLNSVHSSVGGASALRLRAARKVGGSIPGAAFRSSEVPKFRSSCLVKVICKLPVSYL